MTRHPILCAALCATALLGLAPLAASAADTTAAGKAPTSPDQPQPRTGSYKIVKRGANLIHAKCTEGGTVLVPTHERDTAAQRDRDIHEACKTVDYTK